MRSRFPQLGLPVSAIVLLALLAVPRVVAHDLDLVGPAVNLVLVFAPLVIWLVVVLAKRVPSPIVTLAAIGLAYGVFLAIGHQVLWTWAVDEEPRLGGNLADAPDAVQALVVRGFAVVSSIVTGLLVGVAVGIVAWLITRARSGWGEDPIQGGK
ncbi:hypothetical protein EV652_108439 [Kribbella steppae]|uniref:Uncharacterized protein n=1 Tax=Kribbella steppae TaxID=2512223 RepID=A0A4R2HDM7_9ACTN|nr:hypothetical protein [Kribbella steppae]TCO24903.1 hypothetical protein EV652_108439 [Kribbella steppae]